MFKRRTMLAAITAVLVLVLSSHTETTLSSPWFPPPPPQIAPQVIKAETHLAAAVPKRRFKKLPVRPRWKWLNHMAIAATAAGGHIVFVNNATHINPNSTIWPQEKVHPLAAFYDQAVKNGYASSKGFGSLAQWAAACDISTKEPILVIYDRHHAHGVQPSVSWVDTIPVITYGPVIRTQIPFHSIQMATHELAHVWDEAHDWALSAGMATILQNPDNYPTAKARNEGAHEDFAESVTAYLWDGYAANVRWADDDPRFSEQYGEQADAVWALDRYDYIARLFGGETVEAIRTSGPPPTQMPGDEGDSSIFSDTPDIPDTP